LRSFSTPAASPLPTDPRGRMSCSATDTLDLSVSFPAPGLIWLESRSLFGDPDHPTCRRFLERVFRAGEVAGVTITGTGGGAPRAALRFSPKPAPLRGCAGRTAAFLSEPLENGHAGSNGHAWRPEPGNGHVSPGGLAGKNGHAASGAVALADLD